MRGVVIRKAKVIHEDERRKIVSILNGEIGIRDIHLLFMKSGDTKDGFVKQPLGNHSHSYKEICYCLKGKCKYKLKHELTLEEMECVLEEGDIMFRDAYVTHACVCTVDCILLDGAECSWIEEDWNHHKPKEDLM